MHMVYPSPRLTSLPRFVSGPQVIMRDNVADMHITTNPAGASTPDNSTRRATSSRLQRLNTP